MRTFQILTLGAALTAAVAFGQEPPTNPGQQEILNRQRLYPKDRTLPPQTPVPNPRMQPPAALPKLAGTWAVAGGERDGQKVPADRLSGLRALVTADTITLVGRDHRPLYVVGYRLNTAVVPNEIDMTILDGPNKGQVAQGIVRLDGIDELRLCYSPGSQGRPNDFRTLPGGSADFLFILTRAPAALGYAGTWKVVAAESEGAPLDDRFRDGRLILTGDTLVLTDRDRKLVLVAKAALNTGLTPNTIDLTVLDGQYAGQVARGALALDGPDRLRLGYAFGGAAPPPFRTRPGGPVEFVYDLQRVGGAPAGVPGGPQPTVPPDRPAPPKLPGGP